MSLTYHGTVSVNGTSTHHYSDPSDNTHYHVHTHAVGRGSQFISSTTVTVGHASAKSKGPITSLNYGHDHPFTHHGKNQKLHGHIDDPQPDQHTLPSGGMGIVGRGSHSTTSAMSGGGATTGRKQLTETGLAMLREAMSESHGGWMPGHARDSH